MKIKIIPEYFKFLSFIFHTFCRGQLLVSEARAQTPSSGKQKKSPAYNFRRESLQSSQLLNLYSSLIAYFKHLIPFGLQLSYELAKKSNADLHSQRQIYPSVFD